MNNFDSKKFFFIKKIRIIVHWRERERERLVTLCVSEDSIRVLKREGAARNGGGVSHEANCEPLHEPPSQFIAKRHARVFIVNIAKKRFINKNKIFNNNNKLVAKKKKIPKNFEKKNILICLNYY